MPHDPVPVDLGAVHDDHMILVVRDPGDLPAADQTIADRARALVGNALFAAGSRLYDVGLGLCGAAGWWDARTDHLRERSR